MATKNQTYCRHHGAPRQKAPSVVLRDRWSRLACWRNLGRSLSDIPTEEIPGEICQILASLLTDRISDRVAGRFLRALLQRCGSVPDIPGFDSEPPANFQSAPPLASAPMAPAPSSAPPRPPASTAAPAISLEQTLEALDKLGQLGDEHLVAFLRQIAANPQSVPTRQ